MAPQVRDVLNKQGRGTSKERIEKAAKTAFLHSYADFEQPGQLDKGAIQDILETGVSYP